MYITTGLATYYCAISTIYQYVLKMENSSGLEVSNFGLETSETMGSHEYATIAELTHDQFSVLIKNFFLKQWNRI